MLLINSMLISELLLEGLPAVPKLLLFYMVGTGAMSCSLLPFELFLSDKTFTVF